MSELKTIPGLETAHGKLLYPVYLPDATYGMVRAADATDLESAAVESDSNGILVIDALAVMI